MFVNNKNSIEFFTILINIRMRIMSLGVYAGQSCYSYTLPK